MQVRDLIEKLQKFDPSCEVEVEVESPLFDKYGKPLDDTIKVEAVQMDNARYRVLIFAE